METDKKHSRFVVTERPKGVQHQCHTRLDCCFVVDDLERKGVAFTIKDLEARGGKGTPVPQDALPWATYAREKKKRRGW